mgnify:CR=1 FL=1
MTCAVVNNSTACCATDRFCETRVASAVESSTLDTVSAAAVDRERSLVYLTTHTQQQHTVSHPTKQKPVGVETAGGGNGWQGSGLAHRRCGTQQCQRIHASQGDPRTAS